MDRSIAQLLCGEFGDFRSPVTSQVCHVPKQSNPRTAEGHQSKKAAILRGAAEVFSTRGFAAGTTTDIAQKVELSQSAIYYYVGSKNQLLEEIALQVARDMAEALQRSLAAETPADRLRALIVEVTDAVVRDRWAFAVYWREADVLPAAVRAKIEADERAFVAEVQHLVEELQATGELPADASAYIVTRAILGMASWVYQWHRSRSGVTSRQIADTFLLLIGLATE
jgi:TetR/AcrR family transcriptional regulator, cholesterol catabolism regulator